MKNYLPKCLFVLLILAICGLPIFGQVSTAGSIVGTVTDPTGAVVPNATVTAKNKATGKESTATTSDSGNFTIPQVSSGVFTITVQATSGFKKSQVTDVKVDAGTPATVNVVLELGNPQETVTVVGGGELIQTQSATVGTTLTGRQITDIPTASRNALDLVLALPGTSTVGRPRQSSVNGLPKGALNITLDGMNVQDNLLKSNDGFFTYIQPRTDAISEVTVSTSNPGGESSGEGAVQIKFVTQGGGNQYHGGGYWYYRSPGLNANYWFNNRDLKPDPVTGRAPRTDVILNQPGFKVGGPISIPKVFNGKDKAFFFLNYEEYRLPEATLRTRQVLSTAAQGGTYQFFSATNVGSTGLNTALNTTCATAPSGSPSAFLCGTNVYARAAAAGLISTPDPTISALLTSIRSAVPGSSATGDPNIENSTFINHGGQLRRFPTVRFDFNLTKKHHIENIWNYQQFGSQVDFLNSVDPAFPGFPNHGSQTSIRFSDSIGWRWTVSNNIVNEARYGIVGGTVLFFGEVGASQFANQGGYSLGIATAGITSATATTGPQRRNSPVREFSDNLSWTRENHSFNFGATATKVSFWQQLLAPVVPSVVFTASASDTAPTLAFASLPAAAATGAQNLYDVLAGRMTALNATSRLSETTNKYTYLGDTISRAHSLEWGVFAQDNWRFRPNITLTFGLRYERQQAIQADNTTYAGVSYDSLFGESGTGNLFKPGTLTGTRSTYTLFAPGAQAYNNTGIFLPSFGFTYSPNIAKGILHKLAGNSGQTVFRGGFSMASVREGTNVFQAVVGANPGGALAANRSLTLGNLPVGTYLRNGPFAPPPTCVSGLPVGCVPDSPVYPNSGLITDSLNSFDPNIKIGYVESWSMGVQREIGKDNVIEIRYVGNRGHKLWRQVNLNELNIVENGVYSEWKVAQQNLLANIAAGRCQTGITSANCQINFAYFGPGTGTSPLPISVNYFNGAALDPTNPANYGATAFRTASYYNTMNPLNANPLIFGQQLAGTGFENRRTAAGQPCFGVTTNLNAANSSVAGCTGLGLFPYNMFALNAGKRGDPFVVNNTGQTWYDAVTVEFRRRFSRGLLVQGSYTFGKALSNTYASSSSVFDQPATLRNLWLKKGFTPFDIRQGFKTNFIYELPVGKGRTFLGNANGLVDKVLGGWGVNGNIRIQSGIPFNFAGGNGILTLGGNQQNTGNIQLVGMTYKELQKAVGVYRDPDGFIYLLPKDIRDNTFKANNVSITAAGPVYTQGTPTGRFIAPAGFGNCAQAYTGQCGYANMVLHGPAFFRFDLSIAKKIRFTENINLEMRAEFLNAFNNINFQPGAAGNDINTLGSLNATSFGRMTAAYQDLSTTNDPGGRVGQLVLRLNF